MKQASGLSILHKVMQRLCKWKGFDGALRLMLLASISGCCVSYGTDPGRYLSQPGKRSFEYYDKNFHWDPTATKLKIDEAYICPLKDKFPGYEGIHFCSILIFKEDGMVKSNATNCDARYGALDSRKEVFGYFKIAGDSIFFTTKSFYNKDGMRYSGIVRNDTLNLKLEVDETGPVLYETYVLRPYPMYVPVNTD